MRVLVLALEDRGLDVRALVAQAGLDPVSLNTLDARLPLAASTRLWQLAAEQLPEEDLGLWVSRYSSPTTFHALGYAFMASNTLLEGLRRIVRFYSMVSDAAHLNLETQDDKLTLRWQLVAPRLGPSCEGMEAIIALILRSCRKIRGRELAPVSVSLMRPEPRNPQLFEQFFRCEMRYGSPCYEVSFARQDVEQSLLWGNEDLARSNDKVVEEYLRRLELGSVATRLRMLLVRELPSGVQAHDHYAQKLGMSGRSLQRKLTGEGTSFNQVLNETRSDLACAFLGHTPRQSLTEIAFLLGFSDTSSFSRAFQRWHGVSPGSYVS